MSNGNSTAAPSAAGYIFQLERALYHLSRAPKNASVAVEYLDDIAVTEGDRVVLQEQDKHSVRSRRPLLGDRSRELWRTLQIWADRRHTVPDEKCERYLLVTNAAVNAPIVSLIKAQADRSVSAPQIVQALRTAGKVSRHKTSKIQEIIDDVLKYSDEDLERLVSCIEIVEASTASLDASGEVANGFAIDPRLDARVVLQALLGWLTASLQSAWRGQQIGLVSRAACVRQCREIEAGLARRRLLPKPAREVPVDQTDRNRAMARPFVHHLTLIEAEEDDVLQAVDHFIQFNIEKSRLVQEGEIALLEWKDRGDRLTARWKNIFRSTKRDLAGRSASEVGVKILQLSTYDYHEPLGNEVCRELYMTSGHYHRLADEDHVWWHPEYRSKP